VNQPMRRWIGGSNRGRIIRTQRVARLFMRHYLCYGGAPASSLLDPLGSGRLVTTLRSGTRPKAASRDVLKRNGNGQKVSSATRPPQCQVWLTGGPVGRFPSAQVKSRVQTVAHGRPTKDRGG
jgi:hypothetical protein